MAWPIASHCLSDELRWPLRVSAHHSAHHSASAHHIAHIPQALTTTPTIPLVEQVSTRVGRRPTERTWKEEWRAMYSEDRVTHGKPPLSDASVVPGAECSIEVKSKDKKGEIDWRSLMASDDL